jgi:threonine synthase
MSSYELRCRECGKTWGNQPRSLCEDCFSPLEVSYDYDSIRRLVSRQLFASRAPNLEVDVDSRVASARSQEISGATATRMGLGAKRDL